MFRFIKQKIQDLVFLSGKIKRLLLISLGIGLIFEIVKIIPPYIFKEIIDKLIKYNPAQGISLDFIEILLAGYFASLIAMTMIEALSINILMKRITGSEVDVLRKVFRKLINLDVLYHDKNNTGNSVSKILKGSHKLVDMLFQINENIIPIFLQSILTLIVLSYLSISVGISFLIVVPIFVALLINDSKKTHVAREKYHEFYEKYSSSITQSLINVRTVKDFGNEDKETTKAESLLKQYYHYIKIRTDIGVKNIFLEDGIVNLARMITLILSVWLMIKGSITAGTLVFVMTLTEKAYSNLRRLGRAYYRIQDAESGVNRFKRILNEKSTIKDNPDSKHTIKQGEINFDKITFDYDSSTKHALKDVSFRIKPKSVVAFVGRSGSGKSTIIKLLLRHFDPIKGNITINNVNIKNFSFKNLRKDIAVVSQDVELFDDTVLNNIRYGLNNASMKEIVKAAKMAYAHEFIKDFDKGYNTMIGERGIRLSGGQKQRLAIARAILKKPKILIFDEATSSLDSESEKFIHQSIFRLIGKVTLIVIAHRFSTIEHADQIVLLEQGKIKEIGTHKELLKKKGIFRKLRKLQELGEMKK